MGKSLKISPTETVGIKTLADIAVSLKCPTCGHPEVAVADGVARCPACSSAFLMLEDYPRLLDDEVGQLGFIGMTRNEIRALLGLPELSLP